MAPLLDKSTASKYSLPLRLCLSATGGMGAACFCHPFDVIRVQLQVFKGLGFTGTVRNIYSTNGIRGLYSGLSAAFLRQWMYGSFRVGIYSYLINADREKGMKTSFVQTVSYGALSGGIGSFVGTPSEVALVRLSADQRLPPEQRRNYGNVFSCLLRIAKEEGIPKLWTGALPTVLRAIALTSSLLPTTTFLKPHIKESFPPFISSNTYSVTFFATLLASFVANTVCNPFDVVKSRVQQQKPGPDGVLPYKNMVDCFQKCLKNDGMTVFMRGWTPALIKLNRHHTQSFPCSSQRG